MPNGGLPTINLSPLISFDTLDDPPLFLGDTSHDPFVFGQLASSLPDALVDANAYGRVTQSQNPIDDDTPASPMVNAHQTHQIDVYWDLSGPLTSALCGNWAITIFFESMGSDEFDFQIVVPDPGVSFGCAQPDTDRNTRTYHASFTVPADTVQVDPQRGTPYELNISLVLLSTCDNFPAGIVGSIALEDIFFFSA